MTTPADITIQADLMPTKEEMRKWATTIVSDPNPYYEECTVAICREWLSMNPPSPPSRTVRVRGALFINADGKWALYGHSGGTDEETREGATDMMAEYEENHDALHWIEADAPIPERPPPQTIKAELKKESSP